MIRANVALVVAFISHRVLCENFSKTSGKKSRKKWPGAFVKGGTMARPLFLFFLNVPCDGFAAERKEESDA